MQEETLRTALGSSRATLTQLKQIRAALDRAIEREEKQVRGRAVCGPAAGGHEPWQAKGYLVDCRQHDACELSWFT
jgi:hypothetical protein